jgi:purine-binding chemotaxis protein CheW
MEQTTPNRPGTGNEAGRSGDYLTVKIGGQMFGMPVLEIQDVLGPQRITRIPLVPPQVAGALNLRGRIVTAIDARTRLDLPKDTSGDREMSVVVEYRGELYSIIVDEVGEVLALQQIQPNPPTLNPSWRSISSGIVRLQKDLLVIVDIARLLDFTRTETVH